MSLHKLSANIFLFFALFPYVSFGTNDMDIQPWYIIFGSISLLLFILIRVVDKTYYLFIFPFLFLIVGILTTEIYDFIFFRAISSYFSFFIALSLFKIYIDRYGVPIKAFVTVNIIYLLSAVVQIVFGSDVLSFLIIPNSLNTGILRGVHSLTPEPSYFGITLFFLSWIYLVILDYKLSPKIKILFVINILSIVFLAKTSMVIVFLFAALSVFILSAFNRYNVFRLLFMSFFLVIVLFAVINVFLHFNPLSRVANLVFTVQNINHGLIDSILALIAFDASINDRVLNVVFPYYGLFFNYFLPGGFYSYADMSIVLGSYFDNYFWSGFGSNKIMSFVGSFIYELGFLGVIFFASIYSYLQDLYNPKRIFEIVLLFIILNSAIPVSFSFVPILVALMLHRKRDHLYKTNSLHGSHIKQQNEINPN